MKRISVIFFFFLFGVGMEATTSAEEIIYDEDLRAEVEETSYLHLAPYIGAMVSLKDFSSPPSLEQKHQLCPGERFSKQPSLAKCTGLLVRSKYMVTSAHCIGHKSSPLAACRDYHWVFDYELQDKTLHLPQKTYQCKKIIEINRKLDYVIIELHQKVLGRESFLPSSIIRKPLAHEQNFISLGFPSGLPLKITEGHIIHTDQKRAYFNFDSFKGSSGSPVFTEDEGLVGFLSMGKQDYFFNSEKQCYQANQCDKMGKVCLVDDEGAARTAGEGVFLLSRLSRWSKLYKLLTGRKLNWIW